MWCDFRIRIEKYVYEAANRGKEPIKWCEQWLNGNVFLPPLHRWKRHYRWWTFMRRRTRNNDQDKVNGYWKSSSVINLHTRTYVWSDECHSCTTLGACEKYIGYPIQIYEWQREEDRVKLMVMHAAMREECCLKYQNRRNELRIFVRMQHQICLYFLTLRTKKG